jgi:putative transposase
MKQLELGIRTNRWGGKRAGAGRPRRADQHDAPHRPRGSITKNTPVHIVLRARPDVGGFRTPAVLAAVGRAMKAAHQGRPFRIVHISIQHNHIHKLAEATDRISLSSGMRSFTISVARAINRIQNRRGQVFYSGYHATRLTTPRQVRNAIAYVLNNWRHHDEDRGSPALLDRYASGVTFDGWTGQARFAIPDGYEPLPVAQPESWLLSRGWRLHHPLIDPREVPALAKRALRRESDAAGRHCRISPLSSSRSSAFLVGQIDLCSADETRPMSAQRCAARKNPRRLTTARAAP